MTADEGGSANRPVRVLEIDPRSVAAAVLVAGTAALAVRLATQVPRTLVFAVLGAFLALALDPLVVSVRRRLGWRRGAAVAGVLGALGVGAGTLAVLVVPPAMDQARDLPDEIPSVVADLADLPIIGDDLAARDVPRRLETWIEELPSRLSVEDSPIERIVGSLADGVVAAFSTLLAAVALLLDRDDLVTRLRRLVPESRRSTVDRAASLAYRAVGRYAAGSVFVAGIAGTVVLVAGLALGVPLTPLVAVWVAVWDLVPQIGGAVGGVPFVVLGVTQGPVVGIACLVIFVVYLQVENHIVSPIVVGQAIRLSPLATMVAALVGVAAGGVVGALVAVPALGAVGMILADRSEQREAGSHATRTAEAEA